MHSLPLTPKNKEREWTSIQLIARTNNFSQNLSHKLNRQIQHQTTNQEQTREVKKNKTWTTFTYSSPKIRKITNLFKRTNVGISFKNTTRYSSSQSRKQTTGY